MVSARIKELAYRMQQSSAHLISVMYKCSTACSWLAELKRLDNERGFHSSLKTHEVLETK